MDIFALLICFAVPAIFNLRSLIRAGGLQAEAAQERPTEDFFKKPIIIGGLLAGGMTVFLPKTIVIVAAVALLAVAGVLLFKLITMAGDTDIRKSRNLNGLVGPVCDIPQHVDMISRMGRPRPAMFGDIAIFETTIGVKLAKSFLVLLAVALVIGGWNELGPEDLVIFGLLALAAIPFLHFIWTYRVLLDGSILYRKDWLGRQFAYDLTYLEKVSCDGRGSYTLDFGGGGQTYVTAFVDGHRVLKDVLIHALQTNGK